MEKVVVNGKIFYVFLKGNDNVLIFSSRLYTNRNSLKLTNKAEYRKLENTE